MNKIIYSVIFAFLVSSCTTTQVKNTESQPQMNTSTKGIDRSIRPTPGPAPKVNVCGLPIFTLGAGPAVGLMLLSIPLVGVFISG